MKRIKQTAANLALGLAIVYVMFTFEPIHSLFPPTVVIMIRQVLVISFGVCVLLSPESIIRMAERMAPKVQSILGIIFGTGKNKNNDS